MATRYPRGGGQPKTRRNMGPRPAARKKLTPGLKRSKTGKIIDDPNRGRTRNRLKKYRAGIKKGTVRQSRKGPFVSRVKRKR
jgi:hypothetical protein